VRVGELIIGSRTGSAHGASIIDGNVEAPETSDRPVHEVLDFLFMPHIGAVKFGLSAELAQFSGQLLSFIVVPTGNNDSRSFMREGQGYHSSFSAWRNNQLFGAIFRKTR
jgi:hypothetical protein